MHLSMLSPSGVRLPTRIWLQGCPMSRDFINLVPRAFPLKNGWGKMGTRLGFYLYLMSPGWVHLKLFEVYNWPLLAWGWGTLILLTKYVFPGVRNLIVKISSFMPDPPHLRLHIDVWIRIPRGWGILQVVPSTIRISMNFYFIFCNFEVSSSSLFIFSIKSTNLNLHKT